jgi:hypothetical protein
MKKEVRNPLMHNADFKLQKKESSTYIKKMLDFLRKIRKNAAVDDRPFIDIEIEHLKEVKHGATCCCSVCCMFICSLVMMPPM